MKMKNPNILEEDRPFMGEMDLAWNDVGSAKQKTVTLTLCALIVVFLLWASWATVDEVTRGNGQVIPSSRTQIISHLEGGILGETYVREGQIVEKGQLLARVENVGAASMVRDVQNKMWEHRLAIARLNAELNDTEPQFPAAIPATMMNLRDQQLQAFYSRRQKFTGDMNVQNSQVQQKEAEINELQSREKTVEQALTLATRREELTLPMVEKRLHPEVDLLNIQQEIVRLKGDLSMIKETLGKAQNALEEAKFKQVAFVNNYKSEIVAELNKRRSDETSLAESLTTGSDRVERTELRSPMAGVVNKIILHTQGSAVRPSEPIMEIVPSDDTLLIEAKIKPADIGFIYPEQKAIIKLTAYDYNIFGGLEAFVEQIAADTTEGRNQDYYYLVKLRTKEKGLEYRGEKLPIIPGMIASVDIITGKKTVMQYLLKPIMKARENALRER